MSGLPDLTGSDVKVTYTNSTELFSAIGLLSDYTTNASGAPGNTLTPYSSSNTLTATITGSGVLTSGSFTIWGNVTNSSGPNQLLLSGNLITGAAGTAYGYGGDGDNLFQFLFTVTGGSLARAFGGDGSPNEIQGGINLDASFGSQNEFTGSWSGNFNNLYQNSYLGSEIDTFVVPEPRASLFALGAACSLVFVYARRRSIARRIPSPALSP